MSAKEERRAGHAASARNLMRGADRALAEGNYGTCSSLLKRAAQASEQAGRLQFELDMAAEIAEARRVENTDKDQRS